MESGKVPKLWLQRRERKTSLSSQPARMDVSHPSLANLSLEIRCEIPNKPPPPFLSQKKIMHLSESNIAAPNYHLFFDTFIFKEIIFLIHRDSVTYSGLQ